MMGASGAACGARAGVSQRSRRLWSSGFDRQSRWQTLFPRWELCLTVMGAGDCAEDVDAVRRIAEGAEGAKGGQGSLGCLVSRGPASGMAELGRGEAELRDRQHRQRRPRSVQH